MLFFYEIKYSKSISYWNHRIFRCSCSKYFIK